MCAEQHVAPDASQNSRQRLFPKAPSCELHPLYQCEDKSGPGARLFTHQPVRILNPDASSSVAVSDSNLPNRTPRQGLGIEQHLLGYMSAKLGSKPGMRNQLRGAVQRFLGRLGPSCSSSLHVHSACLPYRRHGGGHCMHRLTNASQRHILQENVNASLPRSIRVLHACVRNQTKSKLGVRPHGMAFRGSVAPHMLHGVPCKAQEARLLTFMLR